MKGAKVRRLLGGTIWFHLLYRDSFGAYCDWIWNFNATTTTAVLRFASAVFLFPRRRRWIFIKQLFASGRREGSEKYGAVYDRCNVISCTVPRYLPRGWFADRILADSTSNSEWKIVVFNACLGSIFGIRCWDMRIGEQDVVGRCQLIMIGKWLDILDDSGRKDGPKEIASWYRIFAFLTRDH